MKKRINIILVLAVVFGLVAAWGTYQYLEHMKKTYKSSAKFVTVAVAREKIPARQAITEQMVEFKDLPSNYVNPDAITEKGRVINQVSSSDIFPGEQILKSKILLPNDPSGGLALMVEPGRRAATIAVDSVAGVAGLLKPGDRIDALVLLDGVPGQPPTIASTFIHNIKILAINSNGGANQGDKTSGSQLITMSVNPAEAQQLALASAKGNIRLLLRTPSDQGVTVIPASNITQLVR